MSFFGSVFSGIKSVISAPIKALCNWAEEPLRRSEHSRSESSKDSDVGRDIQRQVGVEKELSNQRMKEQTHQSGLNIKEQSHQTDLQIKRETEIFRIITEIEQLKKDKEFERMKAVSNSMMAYQIELTRINVEAVEAIGSMRIELQRKAYDLIHEKTERYNELQNRALQQAQDQLERIEGNPNMSEVSRNIMINAVDKKLSGIIDNATRFIVQLNDDMQIISKDINLITTSGQDFIQRHLEQFQLIGMSGETTALLENSSEKLVGFEK